MYTAQIDTGTDLLDGAHNLKLGAGMEAVTLLAQQQLEVSRDVATGDV